MITPLVFRKPQQFVPYTNQPPFDLSEYLADDVQVRALLLDNPDISAVLFTATSRLSSFAEGTYELSGVTRNQHAELTAQKARNAWISRLLIMTRPFSVCLPVSP